MNQSTLTESAYEIYKHLHGHAPEVQKREKLQGIIRENGLLQEPPDWLAELLRALARKGNFEDRTIPFEQFFDRRFDIMNFFAELAEEIQIPRVHYGEYSVMSFDPLQISVCFDFEAAGGVAIRFIHWSSETGPYFHRWHEGDPRNRS